LSKKVVLNYSGARCGEGKTEYLVQKIGRTPGLHVLAVDRRDVMDDREWRIRNAAMEVGLMPLIRQIKSPRLGSDDGKVLVKREFPVKRLISTGRLIMSSCWSPMRR